MKKIIFLCLLCFSCTKVLGAEKSTLYFFMSSNCVYCTNALETLNNLQGAYDDDFDIVIFDIDLYDNYELYEYVADLFEEDYYIPLFVVGDDFSNVGYSDTVIIEAINAASDDEYNDLIDEIILNSTSNYSAYSLKVACEKKSITYYEDESYSSEIYEVKVTEEVEVDDESEEYVMEDVTEIEKVVSDDFNYFTVIWGLVFIAIFAIFIFKFY